MKQTITLLKDELLSDNYFTLRNYTYHLEDGKGRQIKQKREVYIRPDAAVVLMYHLKRQTVVLVEQFRMPLWVNQEDGMLLEACAGLLDEDEPAQCIMREALEETGFAIYNLRQCFTLYMSPGGVTERLHFFLAEYEDEAKTQGGGVEDESIIVHEIPYQKALAMMQRGEIKDGKTVILLQQLQLLGIMEQSCNP